MTKRHFIELADTLRDLKPTASDAPKGSPDHRVYSAKLQQWQETAAAALASFCRNQNANFNTPRWFGYIDGDNGPNGGKPRAMPTAR